MSPVCNFVLSQLISVISFFTRFTLVRYLFLDFKNHFILTSTAFFEYKEEGGRFPNPPSYNVATTLPSYDEAERSKEEAAIPLVTGRVVVCLILTQLFQAVSKKTRRAVVVPAFFFVLLLFRRMTLWPGMTLKMPTS